MMQFGAVVALLLAAVASAELLSAYPVTVCGGRPCRPGEGNPSVTHSTNPHTLPPTPTDFLKGPPNDPNSEAYAPLVAAATELAHHHHGKHGHHLVIMCAADNDYREVAENCAPASLDHGPERTLRALATTSSVAR